MNHKLRALALPTALAAALVLAGCGTGHPSGMSGEGMGTTKTGPPTASNTAISKTKNKADVAFATMMIPHHAQAIAMADTALKQATDPKVKALAVKIKAAQSPEMKRMSGCLTSWGEPVPGAADSSDMSGMGGMGGQTGGMMSEDQIADLGKATGSDFDRMWLQMTVKHHQSAVAMAKTALVQGRNPDAKKLAKSIVDGQSTQIAEINAILTETRG
jgi:uncharacterized protein (DUF305 family)